MRQLKSNYSAEFNKEVVLLVTEAGYSMEKENRAITENFTDSEKHMPYRNQN